MAAADGEADLHDRIQVRVDPAAQPVDWDRAVAQFLLAYVRRRATSTLGAAAAEVRDKGNSDDSNHSR
jgi:hypothetical protein